MLDGLTVPIVFLRFNPDAFRVNGARCKVPSSKRHARLVECIRGYQAPRAPTLPPLPPMSVQYLYYSADAAGLPLIFGEEEYDAALKELCLPAILSA